MLTVLRDYAMMCVDGNDAVLQVGGMFMAQVDVKKFELDSISRSWVHQSLTTQRNVLLRSRNKEVTGGEIWVLRGKEIEALNALIAIFG